LRFFSPKKVFKDHIDSHSLNSRPRPNTRD